MHSNFFTKKKNSKQSVANISVPAPEPVAFDAAEASGHMEIVKSCTDAVNVNLSVLQNRDKQIAYGFSSAGAALALSSLIPFGLTIAMAGVAYASYFLGGRDDPYNKFNTALEELAHCCDWALSNPTPDIFKDKNIQDMLKTLAPLVTRKDLVAIMGSDVEAQRVEKALIDLHKQENLDYDATKETTTSLLELPKPAPYKLAEKDDLAYHLYGYKQGGSLAALANVARIYFTKAFQYVCKLAFDAYNGITPDNECGGTAATCRR